jgi:cytochrome c
MTARRFSVTLLLGAIFVLPCVGAADVPVGASSADRDPASRVGLTGAQAFMACAGCHSLEAGAPHGVGPNLHGLAGRRAGSAGGFAYSPALQAAELTWDAGSLTAWIVQTEYLVPGTWMLYHNPLEPTEVSRLVEYLLEQR